MTDIYLHPEHVKALDLEALTIRAIDLQGIYQDARSNLTRVRDTIRAVRTQSTYSYLQFNRAEATRLAEAALAGTAPAASVMPDVLGAPSEGQIELTLTGLDAKVRELEQKLTHLRGAHQVTINCIARKHSELAAQKYLEARAAYTESTAALVALDRALSRAGLPATDVVHIAMDLELPLVSSERTPSSGWSIKFSHLMEPHLRGMPDSYRDSLAQLGLTLKLEG
jgi:hypothetical protein